MTKYAKHHTTKHERDRARRQLTHLSMSELLAGMTGYSNPPAPRPPHDHTPQLDAWADHVAQGYIVK